MPVAWFVVPYKRLGADVPPTRYCAMDDHTATIRADGGDWSEAECLGDHAVVKVRAAAATLVALNAEPGFVGIPGSRLDDPLSSLTGPQRTALRNFITNQLGYPLAELQERFPGGDLGAFTLGDVLRFILRRRLKPRYDAGADEIIVDGAVQPVRPVESVDGAVA